MRAHGSGDARGRSTVGRRAAQAHLGHDQQLPTARRDVELAGTTAEIACQNEAAGGAQQLGGALLGLDAATPARIHGAKVWGDAPAGGRPRTRRVHAEMGGR
ncbi:MAG TPA: hypothetical protein VGL28_13440 [Steroidobacteraceae bacterium]|jgi:hypothetical protein